MDDRLREYNMGKWSGMTGDEIVATTPGMRWDIPERPIPDGETAHQMHERVSGFLHDVIAWHKPGDVIVAVSHGGTLGAVVGAMLGLPVLRRQPFSFGNTAISKTTWEHGQWHMRSLNDRCHLWCECTATYQRNSSERGERRISSGSSACAIARRKCADDTVDGLAYPFEWGLVAGYWSA